MRRRTLLGLTASAGIVGVLGVMGGIADQSSGPPATVAEQPVPPVEEWNRPVVATDTTTAGNEEYGTVRQHASVLDLEPAGRYALVTRYRLIPGSNYDASSGWKTISLAVEHAWRSGSLVSHPGDVVPDDGNDDSNLYLGTDQSRRRYRWHLTFDVPTGDSHTFRFATIVNRDKPPEEGESPVDATFGAGFTNGFHRGSERDLVTAQLVVRGLSE